MDKEAIYKLSPKIEMDLKTKAYALGFARFARLENPSASLYEFLNGLKAELIEKGMPDLFSGGKGIKLNERDEFDFAKELILKGQDSEEKFRLYQNLEELKAWKSKSSLNQPTKELKHKMLERLKPLFNQEITTKDGFKGVFNLKSLSKMTSDKAIQKSVNNGFSKEEHLRAVLDIERLFKNANLAKTYNDEKGGKNVLIHRFNSEFENANALITTKESLDKDLNKIYTLELELTPRFSDEVRPTDTKSNTGGFNSQEHMADENIATIAKTDEQSIAENGIKDDKQAFLQFIKIMQDTKNGDFYPSENLQNALEKSGKKARENALELFIKEYESKDAKLVELLKNIQETRIANKALSLIKHFTQARMMQSAIKAVPSDILMKYVNIDASQRLEVLSSLYGDFSNIMKEVALKGKKIPDPAALSEKGGAYVFNRQFCEELIVKHL
ncbi:hypothetical protein AB2848_001649 [Campylobacter upsaliensis]